MQKQMDSQTYTQEMLLQAAKEIFETMVFLNIEAAPTPTSSLSEDVLLGSITFSGDAVEGGFSFRCNNQCGGVITAQMLGEDVSSDYALEDIDDTIREICNLIMGCVKGHPESPFSHVQVSIPSVTRGSHVKQSLGEGLERICLPVELGDAYFSELVLMWRTSVA